MSRFAAFALSVIVSCSPIPQEAPPSRAVALTQALPPMQMFSTSYVAPATRRILKSPKISSICLSAWKVAAPWQT